ncbi:unnamed protein product [Thelazia callipaeda]|uniref:DH domain-containing protein n=1 Tax=Thelazia callipaeda TaxID=103827 RepID=A0A0N5CQE9_THECL|nr:unnamed protein product [Thelazia callipaeda]
MDLSDKSEAGAKTFEEHLQNIADRMIQYQNYFKEFVKYTTRAKLNTKTIQKALELMMSIPERAADLQYISKIVQYPGDLKKLGRLYRHDPFLVWQNNGTEPTECYAFLFKNTLLLTEKDSKDPSYYKYSASIRVKCLISIYYMY